jgi:hypothetical protein
MSARPRVDAAWPLLAALLAVSLGFKAAAWQRHGLADQASMQVEQAHIAAWLRHAGFRVVAKPGGVASVAAIRGGCRVDATAVDPRGFHREIVALGRPAGATGFYLYRGGRYAEQPLWRTWFGHQLWARSRELGLRLPRAIPLAVVADGCRAADLPARPIGPIA